MVMNKLLPWASPLAETLDPQFLVIKPVIETLFPIREEVVLANPGDASPGWSEELGFTEGEMHRVLREPEDSRPQALMVFRAERGS